MERIKYSIATSWEEALIKAIRNLNDESQDAKIEEIYGSFKSSIVGSGRHSWRLPDVSSKKAESFIKQAHNIGLTFNWMLNAPDFQDKEKDSSWLGRVFEFIEYLGSIGVDILTIAHPFLIKIVKSGFPSFKIRVSLIAGVDTPEKARKYEDMGVDSITLNPHTVNRDFETLISIREAVDCGLGLYTNIPCLDQCRWRNEHYKFIGNTSQEGKSFKKAHIDPFLAMCSLVYLREPLQLLKSPFIRPEDIETYKDLGINFFKLSDRAEKSGFLIKTAKAYMNRSYEGDLFKLIFRNGSKLKVNLQFKNEKINSLDIPITISNNILTELKFIEHIKNLKGEELDKFYETVTEKAVVFKDRGSLQKVENALKSTLKSFREEVREIKSST
ncbi:U32 family peptidase [Desulfobacula sp.]|uniref:U32 family peptidase n=1 Tax=Candidatus Desulfatibia vada TaxID=2841696 RepID=A0A8J6P566_9BACT|nr:U32 family peptidase [Candidatus Desulfatibia vada]MBL6994174.1 U32 family peptidase [Desulfobacula sp.]